MDSITEDKELAQKIYDVATNAGQDSKLLFHALYHALIGKDQGPRLASFFRIIGRQKLENILKVYAE